LALTEGKHLGKQRPSTFSGDIVVHAAGLVEASVSALGAQREPLAHVCWARRLT
jgi:hypothetical protein